MSALIQAIQRTKLTLLAVCVPVLALLLMACTPQEQALLQGIIQNVDAVDGKVTILTKDGKTVTVNITTEGQVQTENSDEATLEALEPGTEIDVEVEDKDASALVAERIVAKQAKIEGIITHIEGNHVTVEAEKSNDKKTSGPVVLNLTETTRIKLEDDAQGRVADLRVGMEIEAKYNPVTKDAIKIKAGEEEAEVEGTITKLEGGSLTIKTERGRELTLKLTDETRIKTDSSGQGAARAGATDALKVGTEVEVKFDPFTREVIEVEVEDKEEDDDKNTDDDKDANDRTPTPGGRAG